MIGAFASLLPLAIWAYLLIGRGGFWRCRERDDAATRSDEETISWPSIAAVIPARDEADMIARCVGSLLRQDYPGRFSIIVVDDQSSDGTAAIATAAASAARGGIGLRVIAGSNVPPGWTGKPWAMRQGLAAIEKDAEPAEFVLFTDADIAYGPETLRRLVAIARARNNVLTSLMVKLRCESLAERWLAPAFVFFFQMLYPFAWVNDPSRSIAAAAGGCMLTQREALNAAGGLEALRGALIDDCALGALLKRRGPIWLGLTDDVHSLRPCPTFASFSQMVTRSAFAELRYSPWRLVGAVLGMCVTYLTPPLFALFGHGAAQAFGALTWLLMALSLTPMLRLYQRPAVTGLALPVIGAAYVIFTIESAVQYWRGRGGYWKGRVQAPTRQTGGA